VKVKVMEPFAHNFQPFLSLLLDNVHLILHDYFGEFN